MSRNRRRTNGAQSSPPASAPEPDDTEPMTQADAAPVTPAETTDAAAPVDGLSGAGPESAAPTDPAGPSDPPSGEDEPQPVVTPPPAGTAAAPGPAEAEGAPEAPAASSKDESQQPVPTPAPPTDTAALAEGGEGGLATTADSKSKLAATPVPTGPDAPPGSAAPATSPEDDQPPEASAKAAHASSGEGAKARAAKAEDEDEGAEPGPGGDEALAVELAAGRVQQPPQQRRSRQRGVRAALATLPVPEPGPSFWADLDAALADQQPLAIAARPAIRPITEPPPLSQPKLSDYLESTNVSGDRVRRTRDGGGGGGADGGRGAADLASPPGKAPDFGLGGSNGRGRKLLAILVVIVLGLLVAGTIMGDGDDEPSTATGGDAGADDQATTTAPPVDATPTTAPAVPGLEPEARLTPLGIGPLQMGMTLGEINAAGIATNVDQPTFDASGGTCFDGRPAGAVDLTLRFHGPEPGVGVDDPAEGVLGAVSIRDVDGSLRATETEVGLGATEELVREAHAGALEVSDNPSRPGGHVYLARSADNPDFGIAYATDGRQVTEISVGEVELIGLNQACA